MKFSRNLPPLTADNEPLHLRIHYLEMLLRLLLCGISAGEFDNHSERQQYVDAIRNEIG